MGRKGKKALTLEKARASLQAKRQQDQVDEDENQHFDGIREEASAPPTPYRTQILLYDVCQQ